MAAHCASFKIYISGTEANDPPTPQDYQETRELFDDFGVQYLFIPSFRRLYELLNWRTSVIKSVL